MKHFQFIIALVIFCLAGFSASAQRKAEESASAKAYYGSPAKHKGKDKKMHASKNRRSIKASKLHARNSKKRYSPVIKG